MTEEPVWHPSPNVGDRRDCVAPDMIVLHYTAMKTAEAARDRLCDPAAQVSAHYVVAEDGRTWQLVRETHRAWHAGAGAWGPVRDVNSHSIGIEIANTGAAPFPERQMVVVENLLRRVMARWRIAPERVVGHSDTAPGRKIDPGPRFDWRRLALQGVAVWPDDSGDPGHFLHDARRFGYDVDAVGEDVVLNAFRMRFRPWAKGPLEDEDRRLMHDLANRWPVAQVALV